MMLSKEYDQALHKLTGGHEIRWRLTPEEIKQYEDECDKHMHDMLIRRLSRQIGTVEWGLGGVSKFIKLAEARSKK